MTIHRITRISLSILTIFWGTFMIGCSSPLLKTKIFGTLTSQQRLLIATKPSDFKNAIVHDIQWAFEGKDCYIKVIDLSELENEAPEDYHAVVILNEYKLFRLDSNVNQFLGKIDDQQKKKIIILTTSGTSTPPDIPDIDALTSASVADQSDAVSEKIIKKVFNLFQLDSPET